MKNDIKPSKVTRTSTGDDDASSIVDYYMMVGIIKKPGEYKIGDRITTDWYNKLGPSEQKKVWNDAGDKWWKEYGYNIFDDYYTESVSAMPENTGDVQDYYMKKVYDKLEGDKKRAKNKISKRYKRTAKKHHLPNKRKNRVDTGILNHNYRLGKSGMVGVKNSITEQITETKLQPSAPYWVLSDPIDTGIEGGYIRIEYVPESGTTTEGVAEIIKVLQSELFGWEYILKHEEFFWEDGAWEMKYDK